MHKRLLLIAAAGVLLLGAIGVLVATGGEPGGPVVNVYSARSHYGDEDAFKLFEKATGVRVKIFGGNAEELYERLRAEGAKTKADVLITVDAGNLWRAEDSGLLQPAGSAVLRRNVPEQLRDPEGRWFALTRRARTVMRSTERVPADAVSRYEDLGDPRWKGRICLRTAASVYNQSLVAAWISERGRDATEQLLRSWMANDPVIVGADTDALEAVKAGQCDLALTNSYYLARILEDDPSFPVAPVWTDQAGRGTHVNISGAGVTRYAQHRADAVRLIEFLTGREAQASFAEANGEYPANAAVEPSGVVRSWGSFKQDPTPVARSGELQAQAVALMSEVGWR